MASRQAFAGFALALAAASASGCSEASSTLTVSGPPDVVRAFVAEQKAPGASDWTLRTRGDDRDSVLEASLVVPDHVTGDDVVALAGAATKRSLSYTIRNEKRTFVLGAEHSESTVQESGA